MPKLKIHKTAAKRFKVTGTGKIFRHPGGTSHLRGHETTSEHKRKEGLREVTGTYKNRVKRLINM